MARSAAGGRQSIGLAVGIVALGILGSAPGALAADWYAAPTGTATGQGTLTSPWALETALQGGPTRTEVKPGDTLYLRGGTYNGKYTGTLQGALGNPITVRSYPGEWAKIDGYIKTTLVNAIDEVTQTVTVADTHPRWNNATVVIGFEHISLLNPHKTLPATWVKAQRGWDGTAISPHPAGAEVILGGNNFTIGGADAIYRDFEVMNSDPVRSQNWMNTQGIYRMRGEAIQHTRSQRIKLINVVAHDGNNGLFSSASGTDAEFYGVLSFNNGYHTDVPGASNQYHGHGTYCQNDPGQPIKWFKDMLVFNNFHFGLKQVSQNANSAGLYHQGIIAFNAGSPQGSGWRFYNILIGSNNGVSDDIQVTKSFFYNPSTYTLSLGYNSPNGKMVFTNNVLFGHQALFTVNPWDSLTVTDNLIVGGGTQPALAAYNRSNTASFELWDRNQYNVGDFRLKGVARTFPQWQQDTGFDATSSWSASLPTAPIVGVLPNAYEPGRAHVAIYNFAKAATVNVDLSTAGLKDGQAYAVINAQNYGDVPVKTGIYQAISPIVAFPMNTPEVLKVAVPIGWHMMPPTTLPEFGAFIVMPIASVPSPQVDTPMMLPFGGLFKAATPVILSVATPNAQIRYTLDGSTPTASSPLYTGSLTIAQNGLLKAQAFASGMQPSPVASAEFIVDPNTAPQVNIARSLVSGTRLILSLPNPVLVLAGVKDDGLPNPPGALQLLKWSKFTNSLYNGLGTTTISNPASPTTQVRFSAPGTYAVQLMAYDGDLTDRAILGIDVVDPAVTPVTNQAPFVDAGSDETAGVASSFQLAGSAVDDALPSGTLSVQWSKVSGPGAVTFTNAADHLSQVTFSAAGTYVLQLTATDGSLSSSDTVTITVTAGGSTPPTPTQVATPTITPNGGTHTSSVTVTLATTTPGASIYYTTNGSAPTATSTQLYAGAITLLNTSTVKAIATAPSMTTSAVASATFTITAAGPTNQAPRVDAGPDQTITLPAGASLDGTVTDDGLPSGASLTTTWSKVSGPGTVTFGSASSVDTTASVSASGTYVLRLTASDSVLSASDDVQITVQAAPVGQVVFTVPSTATAGQSFAVTWTAQGTTDPTDWIGLYAQGAADTAYLAFTYTSGSATGTFYFIAPATPGLYEVRYYPKNGYTRVATSNPISVQLAAVNQAPVVAAGADQTITLPSTATVTGTVTDDGLPAGSQLTTTWSTVSGPGTVTFGNAAALSTTASFSTAGTYVLRLTASDGALSASDAAQITVNPQPTVATPTMTPAGGSHIGGVDVTLACATSGASIRYTLDGSMPTDTSTLYSGPLTISQSVTLQAKATMSGMRSSAIASADFTIIPLNRQPVLVDQQLSVPEDGSLSVDVTASDADGDTLTYQVITGPIHGQLTGAAPALVYAPNANYAGPDAFTVRVDDGRGGTAQATISVSVIAVNDAPVTVDDAATVAEDGTVDIDVLNNDSDVDGGTLAVLALGAPAHGSVLKQAGGIVRYTPTQHFAGSDQWTYTVDDGRGGSAVGLVVVDVSPVNDAPVAAVSLSATQGIAPVTITADGAASSDPDGDALTHAWNFGDGQTGQGASLSHTYATPGSFTVVLTVTDPAGLSDSAQALVTVTPANQLPAVDAGPDTGIRLPDSIRLTGTVSDDGLPSGSLTTQWILRGGAGPATISDPASLATDVQVTVAGVYWFRLTASDGSQSAFDEITVTVFAPLPTNQPPVVAAGADQTITLPSAAALDATVSDDGLPSGSSLTAAWSKVSGPGTVSFGSASAVDTSATFSAAGTYVLRLTVGDGALSASDDLTVTVNPAPSTPPPSEPPISTATNQPPVVNAGPDATARVSRALSLRGTVTDDGLPKPPGAVSKRWRQVSGPAKATIRYETSLTPRFTASRAGTYVVELWASDGALESRDRVTITVYRRWRAPPKSR